MSKKDMEVDVTVTFSGSASLDPDNPPTLSPTYSSSTGVVDSDGNIDLTQLLQSSDQKNETKISFTLAGEIANTFNDDGKSYKPKWPSSGSDAISVSQREQAGGLDVPDGWDKNRNSDTKLTLTDPDDDGSTYDYTLYVKFDGVRCPVDPSIINRSM
ncbi:hypothetical protein [Sphingomicrobium arenosum]|uniref:hypothetical protein n=1 Tax=Sphingomicrobium arenosum TaxID=2233861 RepID=UPI00224080F5|nr:hypothetical protein [Sphingomicrobium arenosum]